jgi:hypothetical protein
MLFKSLLGSLFVVTATSLVSYGYFPVNTPTQTNADKVILQVNAPAVVTGTVFSQPIDPNGKYYLSSALEPDGSDFDQYVWDNFTLQSDQVVTDINWFGLYDPLKFHAGGAAIDFRVSIYPSIAAGTEPAVANPPLIQYQIGGNAGETSIGIVGGIPMNSYTFNLPVPFNASAGVKYWVQVVASQGGSTPDWCFAAGAGGDGSHYRWGSGAGGDSGFRTVPGDIAFTLLGPIPDKLTPTVTWANPADITFGTALSDAQLNATASVPGTFVYTPPAGTVLNAGAGQILSVDFMPTDSANYNNVLGTTVTINVNKVTPTVTWTNPADITFGTALSDIQLNATASVPGTFVYTPPAGTVLNAGAGQILSVDFIPTDSANYNNVLGTTVTINVNKATPTVTWANPADITFGTALSDIQLNATASVPGAFVYSPPAGTVLNAGAGQILSVDFMPTDSANYNDVLGTTVTINVNKATPTVTWANPADITFGTALSDAQLNATASVPGAFVYSPPAGTVLNAGAGQILSVDFIPTDSINYNSAPGTTVTINVNKATPTVTWANPADITFGTALSDAQLNATASVPGTFVYTPPAGTVLNAGTGQILSVDFIPTDSANYNNVPGTTVTINVNTKTTPIITWVDPVDITFGMALSDTQLNATASVPGIFVYTPPAGTVLNAGAGQILSVDFIPTDSANYNNVPGTTVTINVNKATPTVTWANPADITFGTALSDIQLNATASVPGTFVYTPPAGTVLNAGAGQILSVDFIPTDSTNYNNIPGTTVTINVNTKTTPTVTWTNPADIIFGTALSDAQLNATASVPGIFVYTPPAGTVLNAGAGQILSVDFMPTDSANYNNVLGTTVIINVNANATPTVTWTNPADIIFGTALSDTQLNATASVPGTFVYTPPAGTVLNAGAGQILSVDFIPTDSVNYNSVSGTTVTINVNKATPTVTWTNPADIIFGMALSDAQLNATASVPGTFVYTPPAGTVLNAGAGQILSVDFIPTDSANYNNAPGTTVIINVNKATPTVTWTNPADIPYGTPLSDTQLNATASVPGTFVYTPPAGTVLNEGTGQILSVDFMPTDSANYNNVPGTTVTINVFLTNTPGKVTGGGNLNMSDGKATFGFVVQYYNGKLTPSGNLTFKDHNANISLKATSFTLLHIRGNQAIVRGYATVNNQSSLEFELIVDDLGEKGSTDTFKIQIPALNGYSAGGPMSGGNIQISSK